MAGESKKTKVDVFYETQKNIQQLLQTLGHHNAKFGILSLSFPDHSKAMLVVTPVATEVRKIQGKGGRLENLVKKEVNGKLVKVTANIVDFGIESSDKNIKLDICGVLEAKGKNFNGAINAGRNLHFKEPVIKIAAAGNSIDLKFKELSANSQHGIHNVIAELELAKLLQCKFATHASNITIIDKLDCRDVNTGLFNNQTSKNEFKKSVTDDCFILRSFAYINHKKELEWLKAKITPATVVDYYESKGSIEHDNSAEHMCGDDRCKMFYAIAKLKRNPEYVEKFISRVEKSFGTNETRHDLDEISLEDGKIKINGLKPLITDKKYGVYSIFSMQVHHILPKAESYASARLFKYADLNIEREIFNLIILPDKIGKDIYNCGRTVHEGNHILYTNEINRLINQRLNAIDTNAKVDYLETLKNNEVYEEQEFLNTKFKDLSIQELKTIKKESTPKISISDTGDIIMDLGAGRIANLIEMLKIELRKGSPILYRTS